MRNLKSFLEHAKNEMLSQDERNRLRSKDQEAFDAFDDFGMFPDWNPMTNVGDGGNPNIYFVTWDHGTGKESYKWFENYEEAFDEFQNRIETEQPPVQLEDRQQGTLMSWEIDDESNSDDPEPELFNYL